jgi:tetratricopeptide (TPR) repeat protein
VGVVPHSVARIPPAGWTVNALKTFLREIHRRSLWQVLGVFLAASWGVLQVVEVVTESVGLPDWTLGMAFVLLILGLPVVLATAFIQEGIPGASGTSRVSSAPNAAAEASATASLLTWRNALIGGLGAFTLLGISLVTYFVMWTSGIGPVGNLEAQGVFDEGEAVLLAEFGNSSNDPTLGGVVTEALRVDLASSQAITLLSSSRIDETLALMQRDAPDGLTAELAREVASRAGVKAVVEGEVGSAGTGYILVATIRSTETGDPLATFRRTAKSADNVIDAIDGLSQDIREKAGESLRTIKAEAPLDQVTTASLEALRKYSEAEALTEGGQYQRAKELLQEAVALDPGFAMAWRKLAVSIQTAGGEPGEAQAAAARAYELRDRLTELERGNAVAFYHYNVTGDRPAWIAAYEGILEKYPDDPPSLNNLSIAYSQRTRWEDAIALLERAIGGPGESAPAHVNYVASLVGVGRVEDAEAALARMTERYPQRDVWNLWCSWEVAGAAGEWERAHEIGQELSRLPSASPGWLQFGVAPAMSTADAARGRLGEARGHTEAASRTAIVLEDSGEVVRAALRRARVERIAAGDLEAAARALRTVIEGGAFESIPPVARPWEGVVYELIFAEAWDDARTLLGSWAKEGGTASGTALAEARTLLDALSRPEPESAIAALEGYRAQAACPRCGSWQLAELQERAGRPDRAVEMAEEAIRYQAGPPEIVIMLRVVGHERLGDLYAELGENAKAAEHYQAFADAWAGADGEQQPRVRRARTLAEELRAGS